MIRLDRDEDFDSGLFRGDERNPELHGTACLSALTSCSGISLTLSAPPATWQLQHKVYRNNTTIIIIYRKIFCVSHYFLLLQNGIVCDSLMTLWTFIFLPSQLWFAGCLDFVRTANGCGLGRVAHYLRPLFYVCCYLDHSVCKGV